MNKLSRLLKTIDEQILKFLLTLFVFLIPLYPKIPFKTIEYTYVSIRLDDFMVAIIAIVFLVQLVRKKVVLNKYFVLPFLFFWVAVFTSYASGIFLTKTIVYRQVGFLHAFRRIEYMLIFFVASSQIRKLKDFTHFLFAIVVSTFLVMVYGIGQRIAEFPAISTMNPEFARGRILFLTPEARIASTFAGHYDLAAYLVFIIPILWGLYFMTHKRMFPQIEVFFKKSTRIINGTSAYLDRIISTILSISRSKYLFTESLNDLKENFSFTFKQILPILFGALLATLMLSYSLKGYEVAIISTMLFSLLIFVIFYKKHSTGAILLLLGTCIFVLVQTASRSSFLAYLVSTGFFFLFIKKYRYFFIVIAFSLLLTYQNKNLSERFGSTFQVRQFLVNDLTGDIFVLQKMRSDELPAGSRVLVKIDNKKKNTSDEAEVKQEFINKATAAAKLKDPTSSTSSADQYRQVQGIAPDISFDTRLRVEWPRAINSLKRNPLFGTGPSSITESTDNDFLRWLGEFGLVGTIAFLYILFIISSQIYTMSKSVDQSIKPLFYGFLFGVFALLVNAAYIDVFEASKVAYMFWTVSGLFSGIYVLFDKKSS